MLSWSFADGFRLFEHGARAATLAGAFTARADDPSAVFYNPAGLAFQEGFQINPNVSYSPFVSTASSENFANPVKSSSQQIRSDVYASLGVKGRIGLGIGFFVPYNTQTHWPETWAGKRQSIISKFNTHFLRPAAAFKIGERIAVGAGLDIVFSSLEWLHTVVFDIPELVFFDEMDILSHQQLDTKSLSFTAGFLVKPFDFLRIGGRYQHKVKLSYKGVNSFNTYSVGSGYFVTPDGKSYRKSLVVSDFYRSQSVTSRLTLPSEAILGFMFIPHEKFTLQVDVNWTEWSVIDKWEFRAVKSDEELNPDFLWAYGNFYGLVPNYGTQGLALNWKNVVGLKVGAEYYISPVIAIRGGYALRPHPGNDENLTAVHPFADRNILSFGGGYCGPMYSPTDGAVIGNLSFDVFFQAALSKGTSTLLPGVKVDYDSNNYLFGVGVSWKM